MSGCYHAQAYFVVYFFALTGNGIHTVWYDYFLLGVGIDVITHYCMCYLLQVILLKRHSIVC